ncbi:hypothetical protein, partial [Paraburkholderia aspalathi]|uniref:hypothetical protein n=1 Tax=Paraburkholderia aspalathi TaxID=1324617 RepID=UPI001BAD2063
MKTEHFPNQRLKEREKTGPHLTAQEHLGLNGRIALVITNAVGTMWCAYVFAAIALISLPSAVQGGVSTLIAWIAQTFLQLVLLSVIMVGQKVAAAASEFFKLVVASTLGFSGGFSLLVAWLRDDTMVVGAIRI